MTPIQARGSRAMTSRKGLSLIEVIVVLAILAVLFALTLPAILSTREKARETTCRNHLHHLNLAVAQFYEARRELPRPAPPGEVGGWAIDILPFIDQQNLRDSIPQGLKIANAHSTLLRPPRFLVCPVRDTRDSTPAGAMAPSHFVLVAGRGRKSYTLYDAPLALEVPWASSPEMTPEELRKEIGPHHQGFHLASGFQMGVAFESRP